jgi:hypothetical protein
MPIAKPFIFFVGNDQYLQFGPIVSGADHSIIATDCVGTMTIVDKRGRPVAGAADISFLPVAGKNGVYQALIPGAGFNPRPDRNYSTLISLTSASFAATAMWKIPTWITSRDAQTS